jgi:hypothetical protein
VHGYIDIGILIKQLSKDKIRLLNPTLSSSIDRWVCKEEAHKLLGFIYELGHHLRLLPATLEALGAMCDLPDSYVVGTVLKSLATHNQTLFWSHVLELLSVEQSVVAIPVVAEFLIAKRMDLLDPFLNGELVTGRFATGRTRWILQLGLKLHGLNPCQQAQYGAYLSALLNDPKSSTSTCRWAILSLASLPCLLGEELV